jgi:hypothetical protein
MGLGASSPFLIFMPPLPLTSFAPSFAEPAVGVDGEGLLVAVCGSQPEETAAAVNNVRRQAERVMRRSRKGKRGNLGFAAEADRTGDLEQPCSKPRSKLVYGSLSFNIDRNLPPRHRLEFRRPYRLEC